MIYMAQSLVAIDERVAHITWAKNYEGTVKAYNVYMKVNDETPKLIDTLEGNEWFSPPLRLDCEYYFYVTAVNTSGIESDMVNPIKFSLVGAKIEPYFEPSIETVTVSTGVIHTIDLLEYGKDTKIEFEVEL